MPDSIRHPGRLERNWIPAGVYPDENRDRNDAFWEGRLNLLLSLLCDKLPHMFSGLNIGLGPIRGKIKSVLVHDGHLIAVHD